MPLKDYKKLHGNPKSAEHRKKGHVEVTIDGIKGVEMPDKISPWKIERSTGKTVQLDAVLDEVSSSTDADEVADDQLEIRFEFMKNLSESTP